VEFSAVTLSLLPNFNPSFPRVCNVVFDLNKDNYVSVLFVLLLRSYPMLWKLILEKF
jgi:hypothetical protein